LSRFEKLDWLTVYNLTDDDDDDDELMMMTMIMNVQFEGKRAVRLRRVESVAGESVSSNATKKSVFSTKE